METEDTFIHINWDGPHSLEAVEKLNGSTDLGVYQIYGSHPLYGSGVLLYIGRTGGRFAERALKHLVYRNNPDAGHVEVYIGRLFGISRPATLDIWSRHIELAERLLIYANQPADNVQRELGEQLEKDLRRVHVLNWHRYRDLLPEVSGACWTKRFADVPKSRHFDTKDFAQSAQQGAVPKGGPAAPIVNSGVTEGPPSVS